MDFERGLGIVFVGELDLRTIDTSKVKHIEGMFLGCNLDLRGAEDMSYMFYNSIICELVLSDIELSNKVGHIRVFNASNIGEIKGSIRISQDIQS